MIKSVEKALRVLDFVAGGANPPVKLGDIARGVGISNATCAHITQTLCSMKYLERVSRTEGYIVGPQVYNVANVRMYKEELIRIASPFMTRLCHELRENVSLSTYLDNTLYVPYTICYREEKIRAMRLTRGQLFNSASGRVILAYMGKRELAELLNEVGYPSDWHGVNAEEELMYELNNIKLSGACIAEKLPNGKSAVACPLFEHGRARAAVGAYMDAEKFAGEQIERAVSLTQRAANAINKRLEAMG